MKISLYILPALLFLAGNLIGQTISSFTSVQPGVQTSDFIIPSSHTFQYIIEEGDPIDVGGTLPDNLDFAGYVPIAGSSTNGYLSINSELNPSGAVTVLDINFDGGLQKWNVTYSEKIDFTSVVGTVRNCSGTVTDWGTIISCEEQVVTTDLDGNGYNDGGWAVEIDPATKQLIDKRWAMGNFRHENAAIHSNGRTVYQGVDDGTGYIYKFVADTAQKLGSGALYVYSGLKSGGGSWILLNNTTVAERNSTLSQSASVGGTVFSGVEDLEIGPDGKIYVAVKNECRVYRFDDSDPITGTTVTNFETHVGGMSYQIDFGTGTSSEPWACGNDNLAFDGSGNLWVMQDGVQSADRDYIWVVGAAHTQASPDVRLFARTPQGSEPTGITFTPDYKYLFMSIMHPSASNSSTSQLDAFGNSKTFDRDVTLVIALNNDLGGSCPVAGTLCDDGDSTTINDMEDGNCNCVGTPTGSISLCISVSAGDDDAEESGVDGSMYLNSSDLELVNDAGTSAGDQVVGMRFNNVNIPKGATIQNAYIQFTVDETDAVVTALQIRGEDENNASIFVDVNNNISSRNTTAAFVNWSPVAWGSTGANGLDQRTPDLSAIVQEIIDRPGFVPNNALAMIVTGTGVRTAESYNGSAGQSPELCIEYEVIENCETTAPVASTPIVSTTIAALEWTAVSGATGYKITGGVSGGAIVTINRPASPTNFAVSGLSPNRKYLWAVQAICNAAGPVLGPLSNIETFTTQATCNPPASNFTNMITNSTARLNWTTVPGAQGYRISGNALGTSSDIVITAAGGSTSFFDVITLPSSTSFHWKVQAICPDGSRSLATPRDTFTTAVAKSAIADSDASFEQEKQFTVYPNPVKNEINLEIPQIDLKADISIHLYDVKGSLQHQVKIVKREKVVSIKIPNKLKNGAYTVQVFSGEESYSRKILIQR